jgi:hypothetical protein
MTDLDTRCPYQDDKLREAYRRGLMVIDYLIW